MHELSVCVALLDQVQKIAREHDAVLVETITLKIGPLSGVEIPLLKHAYPLAAAGTVAEHAKLKIESIPVTVKCTECGVKSDASPNKLICAACGDFRTQLVSGDEMLLGRVEMSVARS